MGYVHINSAKLSYCSGIMTRYIIFPPVTTVIKCNSINFKEIIFRYTYSKLHENAVTFNPCYSNFTYRFIKFNYIQYNYITCNLVTILATKLINTKRKKTDGKITQTRIGQFNPAVSYQRDEPGAGHRGLALART